jgi:hypothetical protein
MIDGAELNSISSMPVTQADALRASDRPGYSRADEKSTSKTKQAA